MPPNNTATNTPATGFTPNESSPASPPTPTHQQQRALTPLSYLSSPVPDLAATLYTQAADDADEANVSFLRDSLESLDHAADEDRQQQARRTHVDPQRDPRRLSSHTVLPTQQSQPPQTIGTGTTSSTSDDVSRRERLQRVLARLNALHEPATPASGTSSAAYSNRTPSPSRQSLYDWAPSAYEEGRGGGSGHAGDLDAILAELRREQPTTHPEILRVLGQSQLDGTRERVRAAGAGASATGGHTAEDGTNRSQEQLSERRRRERERVTLRSRAVMQRARQESSPSSTDRMLRYVIERERSGMSEEEERARGTGWYRPSPQRPDQLQTLVEARDQSQVADRERDRQERVEAFRRGYLAENMPPRIPRISTPPVPVSTHPSTLPTRDTSSPFLENALRYLSALRECTRYEEALSTAIDHGLATKEFFADKHDDFVMNLEQVDPPSFTSWLQPGATFEGHQHANNGSGVITHVVEQINPHYRNSNVGSGYDHHSGSTRPSQPTQPFDASRPWLSHQFVPPTRHPSGPLSRPHHASQQPTEPQHDQWPVRVTIHTVDTEKMTLQGTMEAYDVPQHPASLSILNPSHDHRPRAGNKQRPITTFLEGQIIDLATHSFLTPDASQSRSSKHHHIYNPSSANHTHVSSSHRPASAYTTTIPFPSASASTDATNWHRLPPFNTLSSTSTASGLARTLLSHSALRSLNQDYVFMRWKERCFVHDSHEEYGCNPEERGGDQDKGHGLTISGFYYVSLRRRDGVVEGCYFDPGSTPVQWLRLQGGRGGTVGSWDFR